jgi:hypothetical protein
MSYCDPQWVSDYTYRALYEDQRDNGGRAGELGEVLLVRVRLDGDVAELLPLYRYAGRVSAASPTDTYQLQFLNAQGEVVATEKLRLVEAVEENLSHRAIIMSLPQIDQDYAGVQLLIDGNVAASRTLHSAPRSAATVLRVGNLIRVTWTDAARAQSIRVANGDGTYTLMGLDVTGGLFEFDGSHVRTLEAVEVISAD